MEIIVALILIVFISVKFYGPKWDKSTKEWEFTPTFLDYPYKK